jgi:protoheme IX farnesyltransferase
MKTSDLTMADAAHAQSVTHTAWWSDYLALTKPRILFMILLTVMMGMVAFAHRQLLMSAIFHALVGTGLIAASASILNQWLEQERDGLMKRTRTRPLPGGRLTSFEVAVFGWLMAILGFGYLAVFTNWPTTIVGFATWLSYVWIYTPLKTWTSWNTLVGTLPGALPVLIGWTAAGGDWQHPHAWLLTMLVILWQFPHFMAIAWLYRDEYDRAGYRMLTNTERTGVAAGWVAVAGAVALFPCSILAVYSPALWPSGLSILLTIGVCAYQLRAALRFLRNRNDPSARRLLYASLLYLPMMMLIVMVISCV